MNCPRCGKPLVGGVALVDGQRESYHFCPDCGRPGESPSRSGSLQPAGDQVGDDSRESEIRAQLVRCGSDQRKHLLAWSALQGWHCRALLALSKLSGRPGELARHLDELRAGLVAELQEIADGRATP